MDPLASISCTDDTGTRVVGCRRVRVNSVGEAGGCLIRTFFSDVEEGAVGDYVLLEGSVLEIGGNLVG